MVHMELTNPSKHSMVIRCHPIILMILTASPGTYQMHKMPMKKVQGGTKAPDFGGWTGCTIAKKVHNSARTFFLNQPICASKLAPHLCKQGINSSVQANCQLNCASKLAPSGWRKGGHLTKKPAPKGHAALAPVLASASIWVAWAPSAPAAASCLL
eukprot:scaffold131169_cov19-Tisochrysis_lutea.AAC.1